MDKNEQKKVIEKVLKSIRKEYNLRDVKMHYRLLMKAETIEELMVRKTNYMNALVKALPSDSDSCPYCEIYMPKGCESCPYGELNGICTSQDSTFEGYFNAKLRLDQQTIRYFRPYRTECKVFTVNSEELARSANKVHKGTIEVFTVDVLYGIFNKDGEWYIADISIRDDLYENLLHKGIYERVYNWLSKNHPKPE